MILETIEINNFELSNFLTDKKFSVILVDSFNANFNISLKVLLKHKFNDEIHFGLIKLPKVDYKVKDIKNLLDMFSTIGLPSVGSIYPGYYFFNNGNLVAYHSWIFEVTQDESKSKRNLRNAAFAAGILDGIIKNNVFQGLETFLNVDSIPKANKIFRHFAEAIEQKKSHSYRRKFKASDDELSKAYRYFGGSVSNTDYEIKKKYRQLQMENHPDRSLLNKEYQTEVSSLITRYYELITNDRKKNKQNS